MDAGLLLKYSRGNDIFPSSDIDFGIKSEDIKKLVLFSEFIKNKNYLVKTLGNTSVIFEGVTIIKKMTPNTIGEIIFPKKIPNLNQILFIGVSIFKFNNPDIKKNIEIINDHNLISP